MIDLVVPCGLVIYPEGLTSGSRSNRATQTLVAATRLLTIADWKLLRNVIFSHSGLSNEFVEENFRYATFAALPMFPISLHLSGLSGGTSSQPYKWSYTLSIDPIAVRESLDGEWHWRYKSSAKRSLSVSPGLHHAARHGYLCPGGIDEYGILNYQALRYKKSVSLMLACARPPEERTAVNEQFMQAVVDAVLRDAELSPYRRSTIYFDPSPVAECYDVKTLRREADRHIILRRPQADAHNKLYPHQSKVLKQLQQQAAGASTWSVNEQTTYNASKFAFLESQRSKESKFHLTFSRNQLPSTEDRYVQLSIAKQRPDTELQQFTIDPRWGSISE